MSVTIMKNGLKLDGVISTEWLIGGALSMALFIGGLSYLVNDNRTEIVENRVSYEARQTVYTSKLDNLTVAITDLTIAMARNTEAKVSELADIQQLQTETKNLREKSINHDLQLQEHDLRLKSIEGTQAP